MRFEDRRIGRVIKKETGIRGSENGQCRVVFEIVPTPDELWCVLANASIPDWEERGVVGKCADGKITLEGPVSTLTDRWLAMAYEAVKEANLLYRRREGSSISAQATVDSIIENWNVDYR